MAFVGTAKLLVAACAAGLLLVDLLLQRAGQPARGRRTRDAALLALGVLGAICWTNLFRFHYVDKPLRDVHVRDVFHHYVGAKYFPELGYTRLYECAAVVELERGHRARVARRTYRNLATNEYEKPVATLDAPERCTDHFSASRWAVFREDVDWFRVREADWDIVPLDWGYNLTPLAALVGRALAGTGATSTLEIRLLTLLDPALALVMWAFVAWAFGWRTLCVGLVFWGTWFPADYLWTGGAFLRRDWLFCTVVGLCLLKRGAPLAAGALLVSGALLKIVPVFVPAGIALGALVRSLRQRRVVVSPPERRLALGGLLAALVLLPLAALGAGGPAAWLGFVENSRIDSQPSPNNMGAKTLLSYRHATRWEATDHDVARIATDASAWRDERRASYARLRALHLALIPAFLVLLALSVERGEDWVAGALGMAAMPVLAELSGYYTEAFVVFALLWPRHPAVGVGLCALPAVHWGLVKLIPGEFELSYALASLAALLFVVWTPWVVLRANRRASRS